MSASLDLSRSGPECQRELPKLAIFLGAAIQPLTRAMHRTAQQLRRRMKFMARRSQSAHMLTDHEQIRRWAEERGARPASVRGTGGRGDVGMIRLDFPGYSGATSLETVEWDEWFQKFDENNLALLVQEQTVRGQKSNFNKLVNRDTSEERGESNGKGNNRSRERAARSNRGSERGRASTRRSASTSRRRAPSRSSKSPSRGTRKSVGAGRSSRSQSRSSGRGERRPTVSARRSSRRSRTSGNEREGSRRRAA